MQILIDECIDERLRNFLPGHNCQTARYAGLAGFKNGALLTAAEEAGFDVLLTVDHGMTYQQNLRGRRIAIVVFRAKSNRLKDLLPHITATLVHLESIKPGQIVNVG
jgi:predicted nuclease of predicted toxin-antitoxin system